MARKTALDQTAKDYWTAYFGEYGKSWVRDIPRRIKANLDSEFARSASPDDSSLVKLEVIPFAHAVGEDSVELEGALRGELSDGARVSHLFLSEWDHEGNLKDLHLRRAPAA
jgi:hypothetical protein